MISDVLSEAVDELDRYLFSSDWRDFYEGPIRAELIALRNAIDAMRTQLDAPPGLLSAAMSSAALGFGGGGECWPDAERALKEITALVQNSALPAHEALIRCGELATAVLDARQALRQEEEGERS